MFSGSKAIRRLSKLILTLQASRIKAQQFKIEARKPISPAAPNSGK
jgi:hypothetical protein